MTPWVCGSTTSARLRLIGYFTFVLGVSATIATSQQTNTVVRKTQTNNSRIRFRSGARRTSRGRSFSAITGAGSSTGLVYEQDCNDPDNPLPTWVCHEVPKSLLPPNYPYYVGHDEPLLEFFSNTPGTGNNVQWKIRLPNTDPTPTQNGSAVANRELYPTFWFSMALCDPASTPFGACTPNSDANTSAAGSAILELQFYPPGSGCPDDSKWCAALTIDELTTNCGEPITAGNITTDGTTGGPRLLMSPGDNILITIKDTASGLRTDVNDLTSSTTGFMVASTANGFTQTLETTHAPLMPVPSGTCSTTPFAYHPEYLTASQANQGSWINDNISISFEIGHFELCGDAGCGTKPDGPDADDTGCGTVLGVGGCTGQDDDHDGLSYQAVWPDGNASHPSTLVIGNALNNGIGPLGFSGGSYKAPFNKLFFQKPNIAGAFYPFYTKAGTGAACVLNFGNDIPGTTTNDFGKTAQYGKIIPNLCAGSPPSITKAFGAATIPLGQTTTLQITIANPNPTLDLTGVSFNDSLPAGLSQTGSVVGTGCGAFSFGGLPTAINVSNVSILAGGTCTITTTVVGLIPGVKNNSTSAITANESDSSGTGASASITVVAPPMLTKKFAAATVPLNQNTVLTFTITNPNPTVALTGVGFTDNLPSGLSAVGPVTSGGVCPASALTFTPSVLTASGITLPPSGACTLSIIVKGIVAGVENNSTSNIASIEGGPGSPGSASITVVAPPVINKMFNLLAIPVGGGTTLSFNILNPNATVSLTVSFTDNLPTGLVVSTPNGLTGSCGAGTITATPGSSIISMTGTIPATASCSFSVNVSGTIDAIAINSVTVQSVEGGAGNTSIARVVVGDVFQVNYASNLDKGDSGINVTNAGTTGNICVNVYAFSPDEQLIDCCACNVTPGGLVSLSANQDLISNTLTPAHPTSVVVKLLATESTVVCDASSPNPASLGLGMLAWGTNLHAVSPSPLTLGVTENKFSSSGLSAAELTRITSLCGFIEANGSGFGICRSCRLGAQGASKQ